MTGVPAERLEWLSAIGILKPRAPDLFKGGDRLRVGMMSALLEAGFTREQIEWAASEGTLNLDHVDQYVVVEPGPRSARTFAERVSDPTPGAELLPALYQILGLPEPGPTTRAEASEEELLGRFLEAWRLAGDDETFSRAARLVAEGTRTAAIGWLALFREQVAGPAQDRTLQGEVEQYPPEVIRASALLVRLLPQMMAWLAQRYVEQTIFAGIVDGFEAVLAARGLGPAPQPAAAGVVFVDVSGYTRLTDQQGDETAVRIASTLQRRAEAVAGEHGGRLVKMLGDGAMLHFSDPGPVVQAAVELIRALAEDLGIEAHAGIHAGPVIERDRDLFGRTVNLASRIAEVAGPGEVVVSGSVLSVLRDDGDGFRFDPLDEATLKGFAQPVPLFRMVATSRGDGP